MVSNEKKNFFKIVAFLIDIVYDVIKKYINKNVIVIGTFESYLNKKKVKHRLFHQFETRACCDCLSDNVDRTKCISRKQFFTLYQSESEKTQTDHKKYVRGQLSQVCICSISPIENIDVKKVDITLANYVIKANEKQERGLDVWMQAIIEIRNDVFHLSDLQELTDSVFRRRWKKLSDSVTGIANLISKAYGKEIENDITFLEDLAVIPEDFLRHHEKLCRDYWKSKCADLEKMQIAEIKSMAARIQYLPFGSSAESMKNEVDEVMEKISSLKFTIDHIIMNVFGNGGLQKMLENAETDLQLNDHKRIPVLLQLDVPISWDMTKIMEAVEDMHSRQSSYMSVKLQSISIDDINILVEIVKSVLHKSDKLQSEVKQMMSDVLISAGVDTSQSTDVNLRMRLVDKKESTMMNISVKLKFKWNIKKKASNTDITSCVIHEGKIFIIDNSNKQVYIINFISESRDQIVLPLIRRPMGIAIIDNDYMAVSDSTENYIDIVDIKDGNVMSTLSIDAVCWGISYLNKELYISYENSERIPIIDIKGNLIRRLPCHSTHVWCITTFQDKMFYADYKSNELYCCDLQGLSIWTFKDDKMDGPLGVTTDDNGNVYVACCRSNKVLAISSDGTDHSEILSADDGLADPRGICFDKSNKLLFVCNEYSGDIFLYDVKNMNNA